MAQGSPGSASAQAGTGEGAHGGTSQGRVQREEPEELQVQLGGNLTPPSSLAPQRHRAPPVNLQTVCSLAWPSRPPLSAPDSQERAPKAIQKSHTSSNYSWLNICSTFIPRWGPPLGGAWGPQEARTPAFQLPPGPRLQTEHHS